MADQGVGVKFEKLCVLGLGYIGLPTASTFASHGLKVVGVDVNPRVIASLNQGKLHIYEPGLRTLVQASLRSGNLVVRQQPETADAFIISVPTPFKEDKKADLSFVTSATEAIVPHLRKGNLVVLESTSPPRTTTDVVVPILERSGLQAGQDFMLAYSPERVLPGQILRELIENARVIGGIDQASAEAGRDLYAIFVRGEIILTDATTAEMVKLMENTYRDVNIGIANEFSRLADRFGVNVWEAVQIANLHPRVSILGPGIGVGGHCISVDPWFFVEAAPDITPLIATARRVNDGQPRFVVDLIRREMGEDLHNRRLAVLGLAYKPNVDDMRESPAVDIARLLAESGAQVKAFDPFKPELQIPGVDVVSSLEEAIADAEAFVLTVGHKELCEIDPAALADKTEARLALDMIHGWKTENWQRAGFTVKGLGIR
ncbi:MAG: nucleotide sugar dehydrogenase [Anaerolineaceae bacterium]|nr:nucleotide sugar dehydrogenase [Anaerolineaceae bacterium]